MTYTFIVISYPIYIFPVICQIITGCQYRHKVYYYVNDYQNTLCKWVQFRMEETLPPEEQSLVNIEKIIKV